jgi:UDP-N-acetyl-D-mannosaminuronic acid transferase (WecB/TagA/CpsF family)
MEPDQSHAVIEDLNKSKSMPRRLTSHGGAVAGAVGIDCFSGFIHGKLLKSTAKSVVFVSELIARVELEGWTVGVLAADSGVLTSSMFK